jgi:uncharacterized delta-60 repeat protein
MKTNFIPRCAWGLLLITCLDLSSSAEDLGSALNAPGLVWTTGGDAPWFAQSAVSHDGVSAAQSGVLTNAYQSTYLHTYVMGPAAMVFWYKVDSDPDWNYFWVSTNNYTALQTDNCDWRPAVLFLGAGSNDIYFQYEMPSSGTEQTRPHSVWVDQVLVTNVTGLAPVVLYQPPATITVPDNYPTNVSFTAAVIGEPPLYYQWRINGTNVFNNNGNSSTFTIGSPGQSDAGGYQLVVSNAWGMVTSAVSTLIVPPSKPLVYQDSLQDVVVAPGSWFEFDAWSYGTEPFAYQWIKDGTNLPSATYYYYYSSSASAADAGAYQLVVTNNYGADTSRVVRVTISTDLPTITSAPQPDVSTPNPGDSISLSVSADGPQQLSYIWQQNGADVQYDEGAGNQDGYWIQRADPTNSGLYRVVVTNNNGAVTSIVCVVAVAPIDPVAIAIDAPQLVVSYSPSWNPWWPDVSPADTHDGLCAARAPSLGPWDSAAFSVTVPGPTNVSFWWRISADTTAYLDIAVDGSVANTLSGETAWQQQTLTLPVGDHTLTWTFRKEGADSVGADTAWVDEVFFSAEAGPGPKITADPQSLTATEGTRVSFSVSATGTPPLSYQWLKGSSPITGATDSSYSIVSVALGDSGSYSVVVTNNAGSAQSASATLTVYPPLQITAGPLDQTVPVGGTAVFNVTAVGRPPLSYQWLKGGSPIAGATDSTYSIAPVALADSGTYSVVVTNLDGSAPSQPSATLTVYIPLQITTGPVDQTVPVGGTAHFSVTATGAAPLTYLWSYQRNGYPVFMYDQTNASLTLSNVQPSQATNYTVYVSDPSYHQLTASARLIVVPLLTVSLSPTNQSVLAGNPATFTASASGTAPFVWQWRHDNSVLSGQATSTLTLGSVQTADTGVYTVMVTDATLQTAQATGRLTLARSPVIMQQPLSYSVCTGAVAVFFASVQSDLPATYQWRKGGTAISGATNVNLVLPNVQPQDAGAYSVLVSSAAGSTPSSSGQLTVHAPPAGVTPGALDTSTAWQTGLGADSWVNAAVLQSDGRLVIGGDFQSIHGLPRKYLARLNPDGTVDLSFNPDYGIEPDMLALQGDGRVIVAGYLGYVISGAGIGLVRLNTDGTRDTSFAIVQLGLDSAGGLDSLVLQPDGKILVGGQFAWVNGSTTRSNLARITSTGTLDTTFAPVIDNQVMAVALQNDGNIVISGFFTRVNGAARAGIARLLANGATDTSFNPGSGFPMQYGFVQPPVTLAIQPDGKIIAGGNFMGYNGTSVSNLMRLTSNGGLDSTFQTPGVNSEVMHAFALPDGNILISGYFSQVGAVTNFGLAKLSTNGAPILSFNFASYTNFQFGSTVPILGADCIYAFGGSMDMVGPYGRGYLARFRLADGALDQTWYPGKGASLGGIVSMALQADGKIVVGGTFQSFNGQAAAGLTRLNPDATIDPAFLSGLRAGDQVFNVTLLPDQRLLVLGNFTNYNGQACAGLVRLFPDGTMDPSFSIGLGPFNYSNPSLEHTTLARQADGRLLVAGWFDTYNGQPRTGLVRLLADGAVDSGFVPQLSDYASISAVLPLPDGSVIVGDQYGLYNRPLIRLGPDGHRDTTFLNSTLYDVASLALQPDGKILFGFDGFDGSEYSIWPGHLPVMRLLPDGSPDPSFSPVWTNGQIDEASAWTFVVQPDGRILLGGYFREDHDTSAGTQEFEHEVIRLEADGSLDRSFQIADSLYLGGSGGIDYVATRSLVPTTDGSLIIGGGFSSIDGIGRNAIARLAYLPACTAVPVALSAPELIGSGQLRFHITAQAGLNYILESATSLTAPNWQPQAPQPGIDGTLFFTAPAPVSGASFWRIQVQCP